MLFCNTSPRKFWTIASICFFSLRKYGHFLLRHFGHFSLVVLKLDITVLINLYFQTFWLKSRNFFSHFKNISVYDWKNRHPTIVFRKHSATEQHVSLAEPFFTPIHAITFILFRVCTHQHTVRTQQLYKMQHCRKCNVFKTPEISKLAFFTAVLLLCCSELLCFMNQI